MVAPVWTTADIWPKLRRTDIAPVRMPPNNLVCVELGRVMNNDNLFDRYFLKKNNQLQFGRGPPLVKHSKPPYVLPFFNPAFPFTMVTLFSFQSSAQTQKRISITSIHYIFPAVHIFFIALWAIVGTDPTLQKLHTINDAPKHLLSSLTINMSEPNALTTWFETSDAALIANISVFLNATSCSPSPWR